MISCTGVWKTSIERLKKFKKTNDEIILQNKTVSRGQWPHSATDKYALVMDRTAKSKQ